MRGAAVIPDLLFAMVITCAYHCGDGNLQHDPTPNAFAAALFASEAECNKNIPRFYSLVAKGGQLVNANGTPAESSASAEKRAYEDYRITCSKVSTDSLKGLK
jgi:hypothetical protein